MKGSASFVGGQSLGDQESPTYTSLLLRKDGSASVVRRTGGAVTPIADWAAVDGVRPHGGKDPEKHAFRIEADTATVTFLVDGTKVAAIPRTDVAADGTFRPPHRPRGQHPRRPTGFHPAAGAAPGCQALRRARPISSHRLSPGSGLGGTAVVPQVAGTANVLGDLTGAYP